MAGLYGRGCNISVGMALVSMSMLSGLEKTRESFAGAELEGQCGTNAPVGT